MFMDYITAQPGIEGKKQIHIVCTHRGIVADSAYYFRKITEEYLANQTKENPYIDNTLMSVDYLGLNIHAKSEVQDHRSETFENEALRKNWRELTVGDSRVIGEEKACFMRF